MSDRLLGGAGASVSEIRPSRELARNLRLASSPHFLCPKEVASLLGLSVRTLEKHRTHGSGPNYTKVGGRIRYTLSDVEDWVKIGRKRSTSDPGNGTIRGATPAVRPKQKPGAHKVQIISLQAEAQKRAGVVTAVDKPCSHLMPTRKWKALTTLIESHPEKSNRQLAKEAGVSHTTVAKIRAELEKAGAIVPVNTRTDARGARRTVHRTTSDKGKR